MLAHQSYSLMQWTPKLCWSVWCSCSVTRWLILSFIGIDFVPFGLLDGDRYISGKSLYRGSASYISLWHWQGWKIGKYGVHVSTAIAEFYLWGDTYSNTFILETGCSRWQVLLAIGLHHSNFRMEKILVVFLYDISNSANFRLWKGILSTSFRQYLEMNTQLWRIFCKTST